jgi:hypothetical protein
MADAPSGRSLAERLQDRQLIKQALARGIRQALWRHKQLGNPICVWEDNKVVWIAPEDIVVEPEPSPAKPEGG